MGSIPLDGELLSSLVDQFEKVMAAGTTARKKDLLHRVVKKVLVEDRLTVEVWYALPNRGAIESWNIRLHRQEISYHPQSGWYDEGPPRGPSG